MHLVRTELTLTRRNLLVAGRCSLVLLALCGMLAKTLTALQNVDLPAHRPAMPQETESPLFLEPKHLSLVMAVHPNCDRSESSLVELRNVYAMMSEEITVTLLTQGDTNAWTEAAKAHLATLATMQARILNDGNGEIARRLGINKSGQVKLFSPNGKILYDGGISPGTNWSGSNAGKEMLVDIINGSGFNPVFAPVYGCKLFESPGCESAARLEIARN